MSGFWALIIFYAHYSKRQRSMTIIMERKMEMEMTMKGMKRTVI